MSVNRSRIASALLAASVAGTALVTPVAASAAPSAATVTCCMRRGVELGARLNPSASFPRAHGWARYEAHRGWREFEVQVWHIGSLNGKRVTVRVQGTVIGTMRVRSGGAHMFRHAGLPSMRAGDVVQVRTGSGKVVVSGKFHRHRHMM